MTVDDYCFSLNRNLHFFVHHHHWDYR